MKSFGAIFPNEIGQMKTVTARDVLTLCLLEGDPHLGSLLTIVCHCLGSVR